MTDVDKRRETIAGVKAANAARWREHPSPEFDATVEPLSGKTISLRTAGGRLHLDTHGEAVLDQDGVIRLRKELDAAFQAVS